jgi:hypothetical protein
VSAPLVTVTPCRPPPWRDPTRPDPLHELPRWVRRHPLSLPVLAIPRIEAGSTQSRVLRRAPVALRRAQHPPPPEPGRRVLSRTIRGGCVGLDPAYPSDQSLRSRSNGRASPIPVRPGDLSKEPLSFSRINPRSNRSSNIFADRSFSSLLTPLGFLDLGFPVLS